MVDYADAAKLQARLVALNPEVGGYDNVQDAIAAGGGGGAGNVVVRKFPFAFDSAGLATGFSCYTPTVGDVLLDAWVEIDTAWDGTTPLGDVGTFAGGGIGGLFGEVNGAIDMTQADMDTVGAGQMGAGWLVQNTGGTSKISDAQAGNIFAASPPASFRLVPLKFLTVDPVKVCVSQDGTNTGSDPGSTQGAGVLYLVTATPA